MSSSIAAAAFSSLASYLRFDRIRLRPVTVSSKTTWMLVEVTTICGMTGVGEATLFRFNVDYSARLPEIEQRLKGKEFTLVLDASVQPPEEDIAGWALLSGIEHALWDILGKAHRKPVHQLLGTARRSNVPIYANINRRTTDRSPEGFAESVRAARQAGFKALKIAPFGDLMPGSKSPNEVFEAGLQRIRAAHKAMDGDGSLMVDCHWRLSSSRSFVLLDLAHDLSIGWLECPMPETSTNFDDLRRFREKSTSAGIPVAGAEQGTSAAYFDRIMDEGIYDIIMPDVKYVGGIVKLLAIGEAAARNGVAFAPHNPSGPVAHLASLHAALVVDKLLCLEHQFDEDPLFWSLNQLPMPQIVSEASEAPSGEGLGFAFGENTKVRFRARV
ncbi:mandelate racemase/muconate lactonizing enzyme family protein [Silicimonas sp. MF1-12-2]|uniref:mandelate racemase/muconate lactonizing enzyme family protein n=1 Tax=Silicimonas sp. MF1-12-2 TaxID=3384793 RepID=UPI0039B51CD0